MEHPNGAKGDAGPKDEARVQKRYQGLHVLVIGTYSKD